MRRHVLSFIVLALTLSTLISAQAQTPAADIDHFKNGIKKTSQGDLDGAIEDYSRAIALSSHLNSSRKGRASASSFADSSDAATDDVRVIDPFTANVYSNRGLVRYQKGDYPGAIDDFTAAIRIRPGLEIAYLNRAAALRANGQWEPALNDLDKAIALK